MKVPILVRTHKCDGANAVWEADKSIDHGNSSDRKWLESHLFWAMRNDRKVVLIPAMGATPATFL